MEEKMNKINREDFNLVTKPEPTLEDYGWTKDYVCELLILEKEYLRDNDYSVYKNDDLNDEDFNNLGIMYSEAVTVKRDMKKAVRYYEYAIQLGSDLAASNLADIYRKGSNGVKINLKKAFKLYNDCLLPYAYYRLGEAYENGWGVKKNLEKAKRNYRIAYEEGHQLAVKKLKEFDFLK